MTRNRKRKRPRPWVVISMALLSIVLVHEGRFYIPKIIRPPKDLAPITVEMKTTAYCHCRRCCSYKWFLFIPYQKTGPFSFRRKHVGITASGVLARPGTIAADTSLYPYGTIMHIPGYGYARVEDIGGAIKGQHIDLYRPNHWIARAWGVRTKQVKVWLPPKLALTAEPQAEGGTQTVDVLDLEPHLLQDAEGVPPTTHTDLFVPE